MKQRITASAIISLMFSSAGLFSQSQFDPAEYAGYLQSVENLTARELSSIYPLPDDYYEGNSAGIAIGEYAFFDSIKIKYDLRAAEIEKLQQNQFVVTERLSFDCFGRALHDIYHKDLPVFVTTDLILHALHASYDEILIDVEVGLLHRRLNGLLERLVSTYPELLQRYEGISELQDPLADVDLYVTIARSLLLGEPQQPHFAAPAQVDAVWQAIQAEQLAIMPLFSTRARKLDFSQFTIRGHYTDERYAHILGPYFKAMMWLGRTDFLLTPPPDMPPWEPSEIKRMNLGAVLLNELLTRADVWDELSEIDAVINFMVGESDNLTPAELDDIVSEQTIGSADGLLQQPDYESLQQALKSSAKAGQRILSSFFIMDPFSSEPDELPVSYRLMGQRFIIDSYIFSNLVYDRIVFDGTKVWRPMPDPLDAMFVLGNDTALPLLEQELDEYHYSAQLASLRHLVDSYDEDFWQVSMYNSWLQAIRKLNPKVHSAGSPFFMTTAAWQQQKLNTQLASWAQLRHDNLLYAKQSYTGGTACSFPHSYIEPYPDFYTQVGEFAKKGEGFFRELALEKPVADFFARLQSIMTILAGLAQKELEGQAFTAAETGFLKTMLFEQAGSGEPPFSGWFADLFYNVWKASEVDYLIADVHTQPTDAFGTIVGRVLHAAVGQVNVGIFLAPAHSDGRRPMAFVGPVMSYYNKITDNFSRLTDERWTAMVHAGDIPPRPDWTSIYLTDVEGRAPAAGRELPHTIYTDVGEQNDITGPQNFVLHQNFPNPFNPSTRITFELPASVHVRLQIYNLLGQRLITLADGTYQPGSHALFWHSRDAQGRALPSGIYVYRITAGSFVASRKLTLLR